VALTATVYTLHVELSDVDRGVYESLDLRLARQPSETAEYMLTRLLAYCLEYGEGIEFTEGVAAGDQPAVLVKDLTGKVTAWIEVGRPAPERLHKGVKLAGRAAVYTHQRIDKVLEQLRSGKIHKAEEIPVYEVPEELLEGLANALERRGELSLSRTEGRLYASLGGQDLEGDLVAHQI
jgi:uncharacterized protein YaeQ